MILLISQFSAFTCISTQSLIANLKNAIFYKANLENANLKNAKITGADFTDANLENAILPEDFAK